ncbi:cytochrome B5-like protein isoform X1 [Lolium perenne]|uniref:cytochrome B5-like protein isoform X1 n=2 Tax=Lolium perenne TaxID=4522 RepID=UPI0021F686DF|nr:cytochrome B5-like protein [Lolium perenne]XP_051187070.1 cytochrome B5-like protein [Lolium perenne]
MEIIIIISLLMLLAVGVWFIIPNSQKKGKAKEMKSGSTGKTSTSFSKEEVSEDNTRKDCWIIIKDKVYDVTPYVEEHPGGDAILNNAGADSTEGFFGPQHGTRVFDIIEDFCIGLLKASS